MVRNKIKNDNIVLSVADRKDPSKLLQVNDGRAGTAEQDLCVCSGKMNAFVQDVYNIQEAVPVDILELFIGFGIFLS